MKETISPRKATRWDEKSILRYCHISGLAGATIAKEHTQKSILKTCNLGNQLALNVKGHAALPLSDASPVLPSIAPSAPKWKITAIAEM